MAYNETSELMVCDTSVGDVQKSPIWDLGRVGANVNEVEISSVSTTRSPPHSHIHTSTIIFK